MSRYSFQVKTTSQFCPQNGDVPGGKVLNVTIDFYLKVADLL